MWTRTSSSIGRPVSKRRDRRIRGVTGDEVTLLSPGIATQPPVARLVKNPTRPTGGRRNPAARSRQTCRRSSSRSSRGRPRQSFRTFCRVAPGMGRTPAYRIGSLSWASRFSNARVGDRVSAGPLDCSHFSLIRMLLCLSGVVRLVGNRVYWRRVPEYVWVNENIDVDLGVAVSPAAATTKAAGRDGPGGMVCRAFTG